MRLSVFEMVRRRRQDEVHAGDEAGSRPNQTIQLMATAFRTQLPCKIAGRKGFILRPDTDTGKYGDPPERILEIATDVNLRDAYKLKDGDVIEVEVSENI
jgi:Domain of unknown function DUF120